MEMDDGEGCTLWLYLIPVNCTYKNGQDGKFNVYFLTIKQLKNKWVTKFYNVSYWSDGIIEASKPL